MTSELALMVEGKTFQLTSSRRGWQKVLNYIGAEWYFNSHPHEEDDHLKRTYKEKRYISTHILTKRMTKAIEKIPYFGLFQLTSSRRGWRFSKILALIAVHFNSHPHEEDDQVEMATRYMTLHFNSHPHEEDDPTFSSLSSSVSSFQLTSSRRGWPKRMYMYSCASIFQLTSSRRGWQNWKRALTEAWLFQLTSSRRGWPCGGCFVVPHSTFQLTSSRRGWLFLAWLLQALLYFNSHPHEEDDLVVVAL